MSLTDKWTAPLPATTSGLSLSNRNTAFSFVLHETGFLPRLQHWEYKMHPDGAISPFWRFYYNPKAGHYLKYQGREHPLNGDRAVFVPENTIYSFGSKRTAPHFWIHFSVPTWEHSPESNLHWIPLTPALRDTLHEITAILQTRHPDSTHVYYLAAATLHLAFASTKLRPRTQISKQLLSIIEKLRATPEKKWPNKEIAHMAGMTTKAIIQRFHLELGTTPGRYLSLLRIRLAARELAFTDRSLEEIADDCGFPNRHYLTRVFSNKMNCSPAHFRRRYQPLPSDQKAGSQKQKHGR